MTPTQPLSVNVSATGSKGVASFGTTDWFTFASNVGVTSLNWFAKSDEVSGFVTTHATQLASQITSSTSGDIVFSNTTSNAGSGTPISFIERMRIANSGNIGIGTSTPNAKIDIFGGGYQSTLGSGVYVQKDVAQWFMNAVSGTGTIKVTLPTSWNTNMSRIVLRGYDFTANTGAWEVVVGGYSYATTPGWYSTSAQINGRPPFTTVRVGHDGTKLVILLGTTTTVVSYFSLHVAEVLSHQGTVMPTTGWSISQITDETGIASIQTPYVISWIGNGNNLSFNNPTGAFLGIGTATPLARAHISYGTTPAAAAETLRLEVTGIPLTDTGPSVSFFAPNGSGTSKESASIAGVQSAVDGGGAIVFKTSASGAGTTPIERMRITSAGLVGIGTNNPQANVDVIGTGVNTDVRAANNGGGTADGQGARLWLHSTGLNADAYILYRTNDGAGGAFNWSEGVDGSDGQKFKIGVGTDISTDTKLTITSSGSVGIGTSSPSYKLDVQGGDINASGSVRAAGVALTSDRRWKRNIMPLKKSMEKIKRINGVSYDWAIDEYPEKYFSQKKQIGVIAQDVQAVYPELISTDKDGFLSVNYLSLIAPLIEAFKEQQKLIENNLLMFKMMQNGMQVIRSLLEDNIRELASIKTDKDKEIAMLKEENKKIKKEASELREALCSLNSQLKICLKRKSTNGE
jgi:hypothetical protein